MKERSILFRFHDPAIAVAAVPRLRASGLKILEACGPYPSEELIEAVGHKKSRVPLFALLAGMSGGIFALWLQCYTAISQFPLNVGGRPLFSWPAFMPVTFELTVLASSCMIIGVFLVSTGLPRLHHPLFEIAEFARASDDRFFVCVQQSIAPGSKITLAELAELFGAEEAYVIPPV
jgi:hypothetical protein